jgi:hypothetical protein
LVLTSRLQEIGKGHAGRYHVDYHEILGAGFRDGSPLEPGRSGEVNDLMGEHVFRDLWVSRLSAGNHGQDET